MERAREGTDTLPDIVLERYRLGELPSDSMRRMAAVIEADEALRMRLATLDASDSDAWTAWSPRAMARPAQARTRAATSARRRWLVPAGAALAATVLVVIGSSILRPAGAPSDTGADHERIKGLEASLVVFRQADGGGAQLGEDAIVRAGDVLRLGYRVARSGYGAIVSVDGRGVLTRHLPADGPQAVALQTGQTMLLDDAFEIDDAPQVERFYLISGERPFDVGPIMHAVQAAARTSDPASASLDLPPSLTVTIFTLRKDPRP